ncbi:MAG: hypothetical protein EOP29_28820, partial [Rhodococcus sp. (in: high G+C Gram-positive bacteria)]
MTFTLSERITTGTFNFPASITVPAGATSGKGYATVNLVSFPGQRLIELRHEGNVVATTLITIKQLRGTLTFDAPSILSGGSTTGYLFLGSPVREALRVLIDCNDTNVVVPREVYVMAGARIVQFPVVTSAVAADRTVSMRAFYGTNGTGEYPVIGNLRLLAVPSIKSLTLPASVYGNGKITGTVRLNTAAKAGGTIVQLSSSDPSLRVPASVTVPQGQYSATFVATASDVASAANAIVTASNPLGSTSAGVSVKPLTITSFTVSPTTATSNTTVTLFVKLASVVGVDTVVLLTSADPTIVSVPASVTIPAGSQSATVTIPLGSIAIVK